MADITINVRTTTSIAGISFQGNTRRTAPGNIGHPVTLPAAKAGTLSTRTSDTAGTLTLASGHGITDGQKIDVYWPDGIAYGATVGTVAGTSVPFTGAAGDVLPAQDTAVTAGVRTEIDTDWDGDKTKILALLCTRRGHVDIHDAEGSELVAELLAGEPFMYVDGVADNPLASVVVDAVHVSNGDAAGTAVFKVGVLYASTE